MFKGTDTTTIYLLGIDKLVERLVYILDEAKTLNLSQSFSTIFFWFFMVCSSEF